jgi:hypothetical protein
MPASVVGAVNLQKALRKFAPDLAKEIQKELAGLLRPVTIKARGFIPSTAPLSGWAKESKTGIFPQWDGRAAKAGIGYKTTPSKTNKSGFKSLARIVNASASGAIYETAGRVSPNGREQAPMATVVAPGNANFGKSIRSGTKTQSKSNNPGAGSMFIQAMNQYSEIVNANDAVGPGRRSRKMKGRAIFRAWKEDGGKTNAAVLKAIEDSKAKFYKAVGYK